MKAESSRDNNEANIQRDRRPQPWRAQEETPVPDRFPVIILYEV